MKNSVIKICGFFLLFHVSIATSRAEIILLDGVPASGKSTLAKLLAESWECELIGADVLAEEINEENPDWSGGLKAGWKEALKLDKAGKKVVFDAWTSDKFIESENLPQVIRVLVYAPLDLVVHRYVQRRVSRKRSIEKSVQEIQQLTQEYFNRFYFADSSTDQLVRGSHQGPGLYSRKTYEVVADTEANTPAENVLKIKNAATLN